MLHVRLAAATLYALVLVTAVLISAALWNPAPLGGDARPPAVNLHALLMTIAFACIGPTAVSLWTVFGRIGAVKGVHALLMTSLVVAIWVGIGDMWAVKTAARAAHLDTLHAWLGLASALACTLAWAPTFLYSCSSFGFCSYIRDKPDEQLGRQASLSRTWHTALGVIGLAGGLASVFTGAVGAGDADAAIGLVHADATLLRCAGLAAAAVGAAAYVTLSIGAAERRRHQWERCADGAGRCGAVSERATPSPSMAELRSKPPADVEAVEPER